MLSLICPLPFPLCIWSRNSAHGMMSPYSRWVVSPHFNLSVNSLKCLLGNFKSSKASSDDWSSQVYAFLAWLPTHHVLTITFHPLSWKTSDCFIRQNAIQLIYKSPQYHNSSNIVQIVGLERWFRGCLSTYTALAEHPSLVSSTKSGGLQLLVTPVPGRSDLPRTSTHMHIPTYTYIHIF